MKPCVKLTTFLPAGAILAGFLWSPAADATSSEQAVVKAAALFDVPTFHAVQLSIQGEDLTAISGIGNEITANTIHFGSTFTYIGQTPTYSAKVSNQIDVNGSDAEGPLTTGVNEAITGEARKYLGESGGLFIGAGAGFAASVVGEEEAVKASLIKGEAGVGRIVDARTIAVAAAVYKALGKKPSIKQLRELAEVLGQASAYAINHPFSADQKFYKAITKVLGTVSTSDIFMIRQIIESPIYNIGARNVGWELGVRGVSMVNNLGEESNVGASAVEQFAGYAVLLDSRTGLVLSERVTRGLSSEMQSVLDESLLLVPEHVTQAEFEVSINRDHSHQWASSVHASVTQMSNSETQEQVPTLAAGINTNVGVGTRGVAGAAFELKDDGGDEAPYEWMLTTSFRLILF